MGIFADFPFSALDDNRRCAVVETELIKVVECLIRCETAAPQSLLLVKDDLCLDVLSDHDGSKSRDGRQRYLHWNLRVNVLESLAGNSGLRNTTRIAVSFADQGQAAQARLRRG